MLDALVCLALSWGWCRWAAVTAIAYHGACRVGEPLTARRKDLILPEDAGLSDHVCFLNISAPKASRRGRGRVQHTKITEASVVKLAATLDSYRRRWDKLLACLEVPLTARLTPGCVRGGGAVYLYHTGTPIANIQWVMRLKGQQTLEHYLQETAALGVVHRLTPSSKHKVQSCAKMLPILLRLFFSDCSSTE